MADRGDDGDDVDLFDGGRAVRLELYRHDGVRGHFQIEGEEAVEMNPGDIKFIPAGVKHWHGASPNSWFSHLAFEVPGEECSNEWLEPVNAEEYNRLK